MNRIVITALTGAALLAAIPQARAQELRIGWIGCGNRGRELLPVFCQHADVKVVALSDVFDSRMDEAAGVDRR